MDSGEESRVTLMDVTRLCADRESRSAPALIPTLPDTLVIWEILVKLGDDLGPSSFFQLRTLNSGWRDAVNHFRAWYAFQTMKRELGDLTVCKATRLRAYLLELRKKLGQPPPTTEMGDFRFHRFACGLENGDITELEFIVNFERAAAGEWELDEDEERDAHSYWWEDDIDMSCTKDGA